MTQVQVPRGRGRPKAFDELDLANRIRSLEDLARIRAALEKNGVSSWATRGPVTMLEAMHNGDPTGGVSERSRARYRQMLAALPKDPLAPKRRSGRIATRSQRGRAHLGLVGATAGVGALAMAGISPAAALHAVAACVAPIMPRTLPEPSELGLAA